MIELKTYTTLNDISKHIQMNSDNNQKTINRLKSMSTILNESISSDFLSLFNENLDITNNSYFYNDKTYRQSATVCTIEANLRRNNKLSFFIECLVDHNRVLIKVKNNPNLPEFNSLINRIRKAYNNESLAELNDINSAKHKAKYGYISSWDKIKAKFRF